MDENDNSNVPAQPGKLKRFYSECVRVLKVTKKPNRMEFMTVAKVAGVGILIIGLIGFIIFALKQLIVG